MSADSLSPAARANLLEGQNRALQLANQGAALADVLELLVRTAEAHSDGSFLCSILLLDPAGKRLRHGAARSLPANYNRAVDGIEIGPNAGSCGTAAYFGHAIVVTDIDDNLLWCDFRDVALAHSLRACWSTPFLAKDRTVLGTFALYYREPRGPSQRDRAIVEIICNTAAAVVESDRLRARVSELQAAGS